MAADSGAMLIEDVRHHFGHHHFNEGPDLATGALSFLTPVLVRQMADVGSGKLELAETTTPAYSGNEPPITRVGPIGPNIF